VAAFENCADANRELLAAGVALLATDRWFASFALNAREHAGPAHSSAMRADNAIRLDDLFQSIERGLLVLEVGLGKDAVCHSRLSGTATI
jgi:hypothetical protein